jgi:hypothetical protein
VGGYGHVILAKMLFPEMAEMVKSPFYERTASSGLASFSAHVLAHVSVRQPEPVTLA